jgi:hypothetical protein
VLVGFVGISGRSWHDEMGLDLDLDLDLIWIWNSNFLV